MPDSETRLGHTVNPDEYAFNPSGVFYPRNLHNLSTYPQRSSITKKKLWYLGIKAPILLTSN